MRTFQNLTKKNLNNNIFIDLYNIKKDKEPISSKSYFIF